MVSDKTTGFPFTRYFLIKIFFLEKFQVHSKSKKRDRHFPSIPLPLHIYIPPDLIINFYDQSGAFVTINEPTLTQSPIVYIILHSWCYTFMSSSKCKMTCTHHYSITPSIFTALRILCAKPISRLSTLVATNLFIVSMIFPFQNGIQLKSYSILSFHIGFIHLVIYI